MGGTVGKPPRGVGASHHTLFQIGVNRVDQRLVFFPPGEAEDRDDADLRTILGFLYRLLNKLDDVKERFQHIRPLQTTLEWDQHPGFRCDHTQTLAELAEAHDIHVEALDPNVLQRTGFLTHCSCPGFRSCVELIGIYACDPGDRPHRIRYYHFLWAPEDTQECSFRIAGYSYSASAAETQCVGSLRMEAEEGLQFPCHSAEQRDSEACQAPNLPFGSPPLRPLP